MFYSRLAVKEHPVIQQEQQFAMVNNENTK
jgi:hypothetical protein